MLTIGEQFEGYNINDLLGESSLTFTFLTETPGKEKLVLKIFKEEMFAREKGISYLRRAREAITHGKIANQAYLSFCKKVATADIPEVGKRAYLIRGYVEGTDLAEWSKEIRTWPETAKVLRKICLGLNHLHLAGLIHGGLCPENIIVSDGTVKVTDFGTGTGFLIPLLQHGELSPEKSLFLPPWHNDPKKFQSPASDIYALGAVLCFLQKGIPPEGIPEDASLPAKKALAGEYKDVGEFLEGIELLLEEEEESREAEEQEDQEEETRKEAEAEQGGEEEEEEHRSDSRPESVPKIEIHGKGIEQEASGLSYRLEKRLKNKGERFSFVFRNLGKNKLLVKARIPSGSDWIQVEPAEISVPPGEQEFWVTLGPAKTPGKKQGKIVLEIPVDEGKSHITRDILISAEFTRYSFSWARKAIKKAMAWGRGRQCWKRWKWVGISAGVILIAFLLYGAVKSGPLYMAKMRSHWNHWWTNSDRTESILHLKENIADQLIWIKNSLLAEGKYLDAIRELKVLEASFPDNQDISIFLDQISRGLNVESELILSSGQAVQQGETASIASGDGFQLRFVPDDTCYLYIYQLDSYNNLAQLFPNTGATLVRNPLEAGEICQVPEGDELFILDENTGKETICFVASRWPARDLEELFALYSDAYGEEERDGYRQGLVERLMLRRQARDAGVGGCFYEECGFWHE